MAESVDDELKDLFASTTASGGAIEPDVLAELHSIMRMHSIPPQELFYKWESYSIKMGQDDMRLNIDTVRALKQDIQDGLERDSRKTKAQASNKRMAPATRNAGGSGDVFGMLDGLSPNTPMGGSKSRVSSAAKRKVESPSISRTKAEPASSPPNVKAYKPVDGGGNIAFNDRANAGQVVEVLNTHLEVPEPPIAPYAESRIKLMAYSDMKKLSYKTMAMKSSEASEILDDRIDDFMLLIQEHHKLRGGPDAMDTDSAPAPLNILIGSGPFSADDNLDFEPLHALCSQAADTYADALILTGPFLDIDHPLIATGDFDLPEEALSEPDSATMTTVFRHLITPAFTQLVNSHPRITIILIPSVKDAICKHASWPQEPFPKSGLGLPKNVRILGNPSSFAINEINMSISSQDILFELRNEEVLGGRPPEPTLLARLPRYLIEQRHLFPLFPPVQRDKLPKTGTEEGIPVGAMLDISYLKLGEMINVKPDVLVVPSSLPPFAKVVESVLVINPGYLSKRRGAGTYARVSAYPATITDEERAGGQMIAHKLFERARVDVVRI
ncbi:hypothetical protein CJF30_00007772 [Rutstroemia sp. NJR-2017a BBW]|nr:hypothetical protein CJF30_00007772 [Rutstroemia sp. NJR-2017a BBW]